MTEAEWNSCIYPIAMLRALPAGAKVSERRWRLFACACCRCIWDRFPDSRNRYLVVAVEEFPDGNFEDSALEEAIADSSACESASRAEPAYWVAKHLGRGFYKFPAAVSAYSVACQVLRIMVDDRGGATQAGQFGLPNRSLADLVRDVFGPGLFRAVSIHPTVLAWNDQLVVRLAQVIYEERRWGDIPILADALLDSGCDNEEIIQHCRQEGAAHARGCFVLDLLLGKE